LSKPSLPSGTRDFGPEQVTKRNYIVDTIKKAFVKYGYQPIETPAMENLSTLMGKYGEEGDQLLFKLLNSGDFSKGVAPEELAQPKKLALKICDRGLRYDLTVPFARFVVMNQNDLVFPFKRYQIQPVWRGDRPQKGRYREFWQCDADVVGSPSLLYEAELVLMMDEVYAELGFPVEIKLNNRKILAGMAEVAGIPDRMGSMTVAIDKLDKIGIEGVRREMLEHGIPAEAVQQVETLLAAPGLEALKPLLAASETGLKGIAELEEVLHRVGRGRPKNRVVFDPTLARGLNYYTGAIFEVKALDVAMGSINGGGRYDDLTGLFGLKGLSGVGISFGLDRIYDVMNELSLFPPALTSAPQILLAAFDGPSFEFAYECLLELRARQVRAELFPEPAKPQKFLKYAHARHIGLVGMIGSEELAARKIMLKDMAAGKQQLVSVSEVG
jgi:histidyl-tRNA synthetase